MALSFRMDHRRLITGAIFGLSVSASCQRSIEHDWRARYPIDRAGLCEWHIGDAQNFEVASSG